MLPKSNVVLHSGYFLIPTIYQMLCLRMRTQRQEYQTLTWWSLHTAGTTSRKHSVSISASTGGQEAGEMCSQGGLPGRAAVPSTVSNLIFKKRICIKENLKIEFITGNLGR